MIKKTLSKRDRKLVCWRHQFLQGSWNYERMQNGGWCYALIPAIQKLYEKKEDQIQALKRHLVFYNTHPYVSAPIMGVTLSLEEQRANGEEVSEEDIQNTKIGMMGPLAGIGDPVFWFTMRPILAALGASFAMNGNLTGPILFFLLWNVIRLAFMWFTQELGYRKGLSISKYLSGGTLARITQGAGLLGMFIMGALVQRWVQINLNGSLAANSIQSILDSLVPGLLGLTLTLGICFLLKKNFSPIVLILGVFALGIVGSLLCIF